MSLDCISGDRRADRRYDFQMDVRFSYSERGVPYVGAGVTVDLSGGGVRFLTDTPPPAGTKAELRIAWPFLLQGSCPLELVVWGSILGTREGPRSDPSALAQDLVGPLSKVSGRP